MPMTSGLLVALASGTQGTCCIGHARQRRGGDSLMSKLFWPQNQSNMLGDIGKTGRSRQHVACLRVWVTRLWARSSFVELSMSPSALAPALHATGTVSRSVTRHPRT